MERSARDLARMDLELLLNLVRSLFRVDQLPTPVRGILHESRMRTTLPMLSYRRRRSLRRRHEHAFCSTCTFDYGFPESKYYVNLKHASRIDRAPWSLSARKDWSPVTRSIARPLMRRREETLRAIERARDIRLPVPLQYALAAETSWPRTSALPLASGRLVNIEACLLFTCRQVQDDS